MRTSYSLQFFAIVVIFFALQSCEMVADPGFNGTISGTLVNKSNVPVYADILTNNLIINAKGEGDISPTIIRVDGKGKYSYSKLYPKVYKIYVNGPVFLSSPDTARIDFSSGNSVVQDFVVEPFVTVNLQLAGTPIDTTVTVNFSATGNQGKIPAVREIYCCTSPYPNRNIGTSAYYSTVTKVVTTDSGVLKITGLKWGVKYYLRMGANGKTGTANDLMNYSDQVIAQIPKKK
jgi:hypothetical protein